MSSDREREAERVREVYARRAERGLDARYDYWQPANLFIYQARERALLHLLHGVNMLPLTGRKVLDVGCGDGFVLREMTRYGANREDLTGVDLLPDRIARARELMPGARIEAADAQALPFEDGQFDLVLAFTLLSTIKDQAVRERVVAEMRRVLRPNGLVIVYDFWTNPLNRSTRPLRRASLEKLFPGAPVQFRNAGLAPPLVKALMSLPGGRFAANLVEVIPFLHTHYIAAVRP